MKYNNFIDQFQAWYSSKNRQKTTRYCGPAYRNQLIQLAKDSHSQELLSQLLEVDPEKQPSALEALNHVF